MPDDARWTASESDLGDMGVTPHPAPGQARGLASSPRTVMATLVGLVTLGLIILLVAMSGATLVGGLDLFLPAGLVLMVALAYANGANDVSKAIATLVGSGVTNYRRAIAWGTVCTVLGGACSALLAAALIGTFTKGFIAASVRQSETFALAVLVGALVRVILATRVAMPVSTTHAITGSLVTVGAIAYGAGNVQWNTLVQKVAIPLALSPFLALAIALAMVVGSLVGGLAVTKMLAEKVTRMDHTEGFAANLTTAVLVAAASNLGLPVSTTHVSSGAIIGIGLREGVGRVRWRVVRDMVLAWLVTLPAVGAFGAAIYLLLLVVRHGA